MPSSKNLSGFTPAWLKCVVCLAAVCSFFVVMVTVLYDRLHWSLLLVVLPFANVGLHFLVTGKPPKRWCVFISPLKHP